MFRSSSFLNIAKQLGPEPDILAEVALCSFSSIRIVFISGRRVMAVVSRSFSICESSR